MAKTDAQLVQATLTGDHGAFREIVERYQKLVFNIIYHSTGARDEVEDLAQEVFLKVFRALATFDTSRPFKSWIARITTNTCLDERRRARHRREYLFSDMGGKDTGTVEHLFEQFLEGSSLSESEERGLLDCLEQAMDQLGEQDRMAFILREMEGLSYAELAETLSATPLAVRIRVSRARKKLRRHLVEILESGRRVHE